MKELLNELDFVFKMISNIPVSGDSVDLMAASRNKLRNIYSAINDKMNAEKTKEIENIDA